MVPDGIFVDSDGNLIGWDGKSDNRAYGVSNKSYISKIKNNSINGETTQLSELSQSETFELPGFQSRVDFITSLSERNMQNHSEIGARIWGLGDTGVV